MKKGLLAYIMTTYKPLTPIFNWQKLKISSDKREYYKGSTAASNCVTVEVCLLKNISYLSFSLEPCSRKTYITLAWAPHLWLSNTIAGLQML